jgi:hypothetical protein
MTECLYSCNASRVTACWTYLVGDIGHVLVLCRPSPLVGVAVVFTAHRWILGLNVALEVVYVRVATLDPRRVVEALTLDRAVLSMIPWKQPTPGTFSYPRECNSNLSLRTYLCCKGLKEAELCPVAGINRNALWPRPYPPRMFVLCFCRVKDLYRAF